MHEFNFSFNPELRPESNYEGRIVEAWSGWDAGCGSYMVGDTALGFAQQRYSNIVIIVLESFSQEYMGCYNQGIMPSFTPFLDSLAQHCVVYQGRANGKKSIEGIPAIFASVPTLMTFPLTLSDYANDSLYALPAILRDNGYHTAFFHGSYNGVMGFDKLCSRMGFEEYYGKNEYMADRLSKESDYDGCWGIYDEHYLQYLSRRLGAFKEPFMAGVFTLSSHHPYTMQPLPARPTGTSTPPLSSPPTTADRGCTASITTTMVGTAYRCWCTVRYMKRYMFRLSVQHGVATRCRPALCSRPT